MYAEDNEITHNPICVNPMTLVHIGFALALGIIAMDLLKK